jgi:DNA-binding MarR family transcriptional regulator
MPENAVSRSEVDEVRAAVAAYVAAGADESVQRVITAVHRVSRRLNQWYDQQLADLDVTGNEWAVLSALARAGGDDGGGGGGGEGGDGLTPSQLAHTAHVAPSSMTHRLARMEARGLVSRETDPANRTRVLVRLTDPGWQLYVATIRESNVVEGDLMAGLTEHQVQQLAGLLEKMLAGLDTAGFPTVEPRDGAVSAQNS